MPKQPSAKDELDLLDVALENLEETQDLVMPFAYALDEATLRTFLGSCGWVRYVRWRRAEGHFETEPNSAELRAAATRNATETAESLVDLYWKARQAAERSPGGGELKA